MSESAVHLLDQAAGYGVLVGVGALFAGGMILTTFLLQRYLHENANSTETFAVANRSVGTFLSASAVYSSWSWSTEFLLVSLMTYNYGIQAGYYYGAGLGNSNCGYECYRDSRQKENPNSTYIVRGNRIEIRQVSTLALLDIIIDL